MAQRYRCKLLSYSHRALDGALAMARRNLLPIKESERKSQHMIVKFATLGGGFDKVVSHVHSFVPTVTHGNNKRCIAVTPGQARGIGEVIKQSCAHLGGAYKDFGCPCLVQKSEFILSGMR